LKKINVIKIISMINSSVRSNLTMIFAFASTCIWGQTKIWSNQLNQNIIYDQSIHNDSITLTINKSDNIWLGKNVIIKTVNYWDNAPIEFSIHTNKNSFYIKRTFLGNNIVGDLIFF